MWHEISTAPFDRDLELAVIDCKRRRSCNLLSLPPCSWRLDQCGNENTCQSAVNTLARLGEILICPPYLACFPTHNYRRRKVLVACRSPLLWPVLWRAKLDPC